MPELSDKDFEELFRRAASEEQFPYDPDAWRQMEAMLDRRRRRRRLLWWFRFGLGAFLLLALLWLLWPGKIADQGAETWPAQPATHSKEPPTASRPESRPHEEPASPFSPPTSADEPADKPTDHVSKEVHSNGRTSTSARGSGINPVAAERAGAPVPEEAPAVLEAVTMPASDSSTIATERALHAPPALPLWSLTPLICCQQPPELGLVLPDIASSPPADSSIDEQPVLDAGPWTLSLLGGGELISIGRNDYDRSNYRIGIGIERRYADRYGISLGAHYVRFNYVADAGEYTPPKGFWTRKIAPVRTFGHCAMLEIPLELHYYHPLDGGSRLQLAAGLVSFIMVKQRYYYMYDQPDPDLIRKWKTDKADDYLLSAAVLSAGFQIPLRRHLSLGIVPYAQLPLAGIGHGKVKLYSAGLALQLGWSPPNSAISNR